MGSVNRGDNRCPICDHKGCDIWSGTIHGEYCFQCPNCGEFFVWQVDFGSLRGYNIQHLRSYLFYHSSNNRPYIVPKELYDKIDKTGFVDIYNLTPEMVENWYPKSFGEKIDLILNGIDALADYEGDYVKITDCMSDLYFCHPVPQKEKSVLIQRAYIQDYLVKNDYITEAGDGMIQLTPKAYERIYELKKSQSNNKNVFVSMAFNDATKSTREAIRQGIINAGYSPEFIDEIIHNHQIMPEMFRLIRESRLLVLEITDPNFGAYYEAGYALGLGKEVIICCKKDVFQRTYETEEEKKYERYMKPHFDIAQKQILVWNDEADLTQKLPEWIKAVE